MVRHFGLEGTLALLSSGAIEIRCDCTQFAEGQFNTPPYPPLTLQFHVIKAPIHDQYVIDNLANVNRTPGLNSYQLMNLQSAAMKAVRQPAYREVYRTSIAPSLESDVLHSDRLVKSSVRYILQKHHKVSVPEDFDLRFHKVGDDGYRAGTNLPERLPLSTDELHNSLKTALLGVAGVNQCIGEMKAHTALSGFTDEELPQFRTKLDSLVDVHGSTNQERRFERLITVGGLPKISSDSQINIVKLLKIHEEPESIEFRSWLTDLDNYDDAEIRKRLNGFNARLGLAVQTATGKVIRLIATGVAGIHPSLGI